MSDTLVLTPEQEVALEQYRQVCIREGRSDEPAIRDVAEKQFANVYQTINRPVPEVWWCDGPTSASLYRFVASSNCVSKESGKQAMRKALSLEFTEPVFDSFKRLVGQNKKLKHLLDETPNGGEKLSDAVSKRLEESFSWTFWGQYEIYWPAFYLWPDQNVKPLYTEDQRQKLQWWLDLARSCGWWHPYEKPSIVFACERHAHLHVDDQDRLHAEDTSCVLFRDGQEVFAWHGVLVPRDVIMSPDTLTPEKVDATHDAKVARVMVERMSPEKYFEAAPSLVVHKSDMGVLYRKAFSSDDQMTMLKLNGKVAGKKASEWFLIEDTEVATVEAAKAWQLGLRGGSRE